MKLAHTWRLAAGVVLGLLLPRTVSAFDTCAGQMHSRVRQNWKFLSDNEPANQATHIFNEFIAMANAHTLTDRASSIESSISGDDTPEYTVDRWYDDHVCSRYFLGSAHGGTVGPCVELFEDFGDRNSRLTALRAAGWRPADTTPPGITTGFLSAVPVNNPTSSAEMYGIVLRPEAMQDSFPNMDGNGIGVLVWCNSNSAEQYYESHGAKAVFASPGVCALQVPARAVAAALGCAFVFDDPSYGSTAGEANRKLKAVGQSSYLRLNTYCELDMECAGLRLSTTTCSRPAATFLRVSKVGSQVSWTAVEYGTKAYYICGFSEPKGTPDFVRRVDPSPLGGRGRTVPYNESVGESFPYWEIVEVEHGSTHKDYSRFFREGEVWVDTESGASVMEIRENPARLVAESQYPPVTLALEGLDEQGRPIDVTDSVEPTRQAADLRTYSSSSPCISCPTGLPTPDSTSCADYFVFSNSYSWSYEARDSLLTYIPGRGIISWAGPNPEMAREGLRILICRNRRWNTWAADENPPVARRFPEALPLIIVGTPGYLEHEAGEPGGLAGVIVAYDTLTAPDGLCNAICVVDGRMASPWPDCPDSVAVPYTRIPATTLAELRTTLRAAKEYSMGLYVDALRRLIPIAGDVAINSMGPGPLNPCSGLSPVAEGTHLFMEYVRGVVGPSYDTVRQSDGCAVRQAEVLNDLNSSSGGASLIIGLGHLGSETWFPGIGEVAASSMTRQQRFVSLLPSCNTARAIYQQTSRTDAEMLLFNDPNKTQLAFLTGFSTDTSYDDNEIWLLYLLAELENVRGESGFHTWQDVVFRAQQAFGRDTGRWTIMQRVGNLGAPVRIPTDLITGVPGPEADSVINGVPRVFPNPAGAGQVCRILFSLSEATRVSLDVLDITGRRVASIPAQTWEPGVHSMSWGGVGDDGRRVASGIYFGKLTAGTATRVVRIVRVN